MASRSPSLTREFSDSVLFLLKIMDLLMSFQLNVDILMVVGKNVVSLLELEPWTKQGSPSQEHNPSANSE